MKKVLFTLLLILCLSSLSAQEKGKLRVGADLGLVSIFPENSEGQYFGKNYSLGLHYNLTDKMNIGLKYIHQNFDLTSSDIYKTFSNNYLFQQFIPSELDGESLLVDYNYYLHKNRSPITHYFEFGAGVLYLPTNNFSSYYYTISGGGGVNVVFPKYALSEIVAYGIEFNHVRLSLEYMFSFPTLSNNLISSDTFLNRLTLNLGFYIGGGSLRN